MVVEQNSGRIPSALGINALHMKKLFSVLQRIPLQAINVEKNMDFFLCSLVNLVISTCSHELLMFQVITLLVLQIFPGENEYALKNHIRGYIETSGSHLLKSKHSALGLSQKAEKR
jgi:hypothetical protein